MMLTIVEHPRYWKGLIDEHRHADPPFAVANALESPGRHLDSTIVFAMAGEIFSPP